MRSRPERRIESPFCQGSRSAVKLAAAAASSLAFYGVRQLHGCNRTTGAGSAIVRSVRSDDLREIAVGFRHRIMGGIDHPLVMGPSSHSKSLPVQRCRKRWRGDQIFAQCAQVASSERYFASSSIIRCASGAAALRASASMVSSGSSAGAWCRNGSWRTSTAKEKIQPHRFARCHGSYGSSAVQLQRQAFSQRAASSVDARSAPELISAGRRGR